MVLDRYWLSLDGVNRNRTATMLIVQAPVGWRQSLARISINGKLLYEFLDHGNTWTEGHFAFQQHDPGSRVEIRKIEVQELP
jgi:hypothetical protein